MFVQFFDRNFNAAQFHLSSVEVEELSWKLPGGSERARVRVMGSLEELQAFGERLRYGVEVRDEVGSVCWSGYLHGFEVEHEGVVVEASLEEMYNRVASWYTPSLPGSEGDGQITLTGWAADTESIGVWGTKELRVKTGFYSALQAAALRDRLLAKHRLPGCRLRRKTRQGPPGGRAACRLTCRGWHATLDWAYYTQLGGWEGYVAEGVGVAPVGNVAANTQAAQSFQLGYAAGWEADQVYIKLKRVNSPADNLVVELCADAAGAPGAALQSVSMAGASVPNTYRHIPFNLPNRQALAAGTPYWVRVRRSGGLDVLHYYALQTNDALGYPRGVFRLWNGSAWSARAPDTDLNFQVKGTRETTAQMGDVYAAGGQFLTGMRLDNNSGLWQAFYRSGERTAREELEALLAAGDAAGVELLGMVDHQRVLSVWAAPGAPVGGAQFIIEGDGLLHRAGGALVKAGENWLGQWMDYAGYLRPGGSVAAAGLQLIRRGVYAPGRGVEVGMGEETIDARRG